jgi:hypothetical protein
MADTRAFAADAGDATRPDRWIGELTASAQVPGEEA